MRPQQRRTWQKARAGGDVTQLAADLDLDLHLSPPPEPQVPWPVWVGGVPRLAAAFQPRAAARAAIDRARAEGDAGRAVLSQVLSGGGGVGKSQLAALLARELRDEERGPDSGLDVLVWAGAGKPDQIITVYAAAAERLRLPGGGAGDLTTAARAFLAWLAATERRWLVVLDDVAEPAEIDAWWPDGNPRNGRVLATTRRDDALLSGQGRRLVRLDLYTREEAAAYLRRRLTDAGHPHLFDEATAGRLAEALDLLPLALGHAAAYMINKRCDTATYLARFQAADGRLPDVLPADADTEGYGRSVAAALLVSLDAVRGADPTGLAQPLLRLVGLMDPRGHPAALWTTLPALAHLGTGRPARRWWPLRRRPPATAEEVAAALECLRTYALVAQDTDRSPIRMHALTARAVRERIPAAELPALARAAADALVSLWPVHDHADRELSATLRANTLSLTQHTGRCLWRPDTHGCLFWASRSLSTAGLFREAVVFNQHNYRQTLAALGPDHPDTLGARGNLAISYSQAGRFQEALDLREQVLADSERALGADHPDTIRARGNLAISYSQAGRFQEALDLREQVLADCERALGADHPDTIGARHNLGSSYGDAGRVDDAVSLLEQVVADSERVFGPQHPSTISTRHNLASSHSRAGHTEEAIALYERVLADCERVLGTDHPDTLGARGNLAICYGNAGRIRDALSLHEQVLVDRERVLGADHPDTVKARHSLANSYGDSGRVHDAMVLHRQVLADSERVLGPDHPETRKARRNLARTRRRVEAAKQPGKAPAAAESQKARPAAEDGGAS